MVKTIAVSFSFSSLPDIEQAFAWPLLCSKQGNCAHPPEGESFKPDADTFNYGLVLGAQLPTPLSIRVWGGWIAGSEFDPDSENNLDIKFESGSGWRVGAGIKLALVSLNLEYQKITYDETVLESVGPFNANDSFSDVELKNKGYVLSVSFPLSL